jgi:uncharacterized protein (TIGR02118 family)
MVQRLVFPLRRRPGLSREDFQAYWWGSHGPLVAERAERLGIRRYQQVHTVRSARPGTVEGFDGVAELWFDGVTATADPEERRVLGADLLADEQHFIDLAASPLWMADEVVLRDGVMEGLRLTAFLRRQPHLTRAEFSKHWREVHGPLALAHPDVLGFRRYVQLHTTNDAESFPLRAPRGAPAPFDGTSEVWLDEVDPDAVHAAEVRSVVDADEARLFIRAESPLMLGEVRVVVDRF